MFDLSQVLTGAYIRTIAGIRDLGEIIAAYVTHPEGGSVTTIAPDRSDIYVKIIDAISDAPIIGRLFTPLNIMFRLPLNNDNVMVARGQDTHGPGASLVMHGMGGTANTVPPWLDANNSGIYLSEGFLIESTKDKIIITSNSSGTPATVTLNKDGSIVLNGGNLQVARATDPLTLGTIVVAGTGVASVTYIPAGGVVPGPAGLAAAITGTIASGNPTIKG